MVEEKRGPGRPRKEDERRKQARQERGTGIIGRLGVRESALDLGRFKYRWVNDDGVRMHRFTEQDDWAPVTQEGGEVKDSSNIGAAISAVAGTKENGQPMRAYLLRKRKDWWEADQRQKIEEIDEMFNQMRRGNDPDGSKGAGIYATQGNSI